MSDSPDSSSSAAQRAHEVEDIPEPSPGFFARFFGSDETPAKSDGNGQEAKNQHPAESAAYAAISMYNLRRLRVDDVSVPRVEIKAVPSDISLADLIEVFRSSGYSRLPVFEGTMDTPKGLIHLKDLALNYGFNGAVNDFNVMDTLRPLIFAPPSMPIGVLLQKMQTDRRHMALVIDEYGGVDGLVTIEDLIEQIIGEIEDEHDVAEDKLWVEEAPGCWMVYSRAPLDEFEAVIGEDLTNGLEDDEVDTIGGVIFLLAGRVPARGEIVPHPNGTEFEVVDADPRRVKRVRVRKQGGGA